MTTADGGSPFATKADLFQANADGSRGSWLGSAFTAADGTYSFDPVEPGAYVITFVAPAGGSFNGSPYSQSSPFTIS